MSFALIVTLLTLIGAVALFVTERLRVDLVALTVLLVLVVTGVVAPEDAIRGFSNPATVTIAAMFVLSAALVQTGVTHLAGDLFARVAGSSLTGALAGLMITVGLLSAFMNNTAVVAMFLPVVMGVAARSDIAPSKLLMPLSFASMFGGVCTLVGTSTNILASEVARQAGRAPIGMFEMLPLGAVLFVLGLVYMVVAGSRLVPERRAAENLQRTFRMADYLTDLEVAPGSDSVGRTLAEAPLVSRFDLDVLELVRADGDRFPLPSPDKVLQAGDVLRVRSDVSRIRELQSQAGISLLGHDPAASAGASGAVLVEAVVLPGSGLERRSLVESRFRNTYGATVLAVRQRGEIVHQNLKAVPLAAGDTLLLETRPADIEQLRASDDLAVVSETASSHQPLQRGRLVLATSLLAGAVGAAALGWAPIVATATVAAILAVLTGCLSLDDAYAAIDWTVIFLLAGVLTLGTALESSGAAELLAETLLAGLGPLGPLAVVSGLYLATTLLTETMSNNATVALLAPIALVTADTLGVDHRPLLMAVTFAASASFMTPVGYQTNTLIYGPGKYRFGDFLRVGAPLNLLFWIASSLLIPLIWPL
jgi:di/tricarboxylate transporter